MEFLPETGNMYEVFGRIWPMYMEFFGTPLPCPGNQLITSMQTYMTNQGAEIRLGVLENDEQPSGW
jgi:hypothetical protein